MVRWYVWGVLTAAISAVGCFNTNEVKWTGIAGSGPATTVLSVSSFSPPLGPTSGGTPMTIQGAGFGRDKTTVSVDIGGSPCTLIGYTSTQIDCVTTPSGTVGPASVRVRNSNGDEASGGSFVYQGAVPTITNVSPTNGTMLGGTSITVTVTNPFTASISINGINCAVTAAGPPIVCTTGASTAGTYNVVMTNIDGQSASYASFTYNPAPVISGIVPTSCVDAGGTAVVISGTGFVAPTVSIGGANCALGSSTATTINCTTSASTTGAKNIVVTNSDAQTATLVGGYTYVLPAPTISSITPTNGKLAAGTAVQINGTNFNTPTVTIGGASCTGLTNNSTTINCNAPAGTAGPATVVVTNVDAQTVNTSYTYNPFPTFSAVSPNTALTTGGGALTIDGTGFISGLSVTVGGSACGGLSFVSSTQVTCTAPALAAGAKNIVITNPDTQDVTAVGAITYSVPPGPSIASISPTGGIVAGAYTITINGSNFSGPSVTIGGNNCTGVGGNATQITCTVPAGTVGAKSLVVTNADAQNTSTTFTYITPMTNTWVGAKPNNHNTWANGGRATAGMGDGILNQPTLTFADTTNNYLYVADYYNARLVRINLTTHAFAGWIGFIADVTPASGAGCNGLTQTPTPGWCFGGTSRYSGVYGALDWFYGFWVDTAANKIYISDYYNARIQKYDGVTGAVEGWIGGVSITPSGGAAGCNATSSGQPTPGWCTGGYAQSGAGDGFLSYPKGIWGDATSLYVVDGNNHRLAKFNKATGAFVGTLGKMTASSGTCAASGFSGAWCTGGTSDLGNGDGMLSSPHGITGDAVYLYVADTNNNRINRYTAATGAFQGWIGRSTSALTGSGACTGLTPPGNNPDWCFGGTPSSTYAQGGFAYPSGVTLYSGKLYVTGDDAKVSKFDAATAAFETWIGRVASGAGSCLPNGGVPAGWCSSAGATSTSGLDDGMLYYPKGLSVTASYVYVADTANHRMVRYDATTGAQTGWWGGEAAPQGTWTASLNISSGGTGDGMVKGANSVARNGTTLYVADSDNHRITKWNATTGAFLGWIGCVDQVPTGGGGTCTSTSVGSVTPQWCTGGVSRYSTNTEGCLYYPSAIAVYGGNIYVGDSNHRITRYSEATGTVNGWIGKVGFTAVTGGSCNGLGTLTTTTGWCSGATSFSTISGNSDGAFSYPRGLFVDASNIYVSDSSNHRVVRFSLAGIFSGWVGRTASVPTSPAPCTAISGGDATPQWCTGGTSQAGAFDGMLDGPKAIVGDGSYLFVSDASNDRVVRIDKATGMFSGFVGKVTSGSLSGSAACTSFVAPGVSPEWCFGGLSTTTDWSSLTGGLDSPSGIDLDSVGNLYVSEISSARIQKFDSATGQTKGWIGAVLGIPTGGFGCSAAAQTTFTPSWCTGGSAYYHAAGFQAPASVVVDYNGTASSGSVYILDSTKHQLIKISPAGH